MNMSESLVDLTTTIFKANIALAVIFGLGFIFAKHTSAAVSSVPFDLAAVLTVRHLAV